MVKKKVNLNIADIPVCLIAEGGDAFRMQEFFTPFLSGNAPEYIIRVFFSDVSPAAKMLSTRAFLHNGKLQVHSEEFIGHLDLVKGQGRVDVCSTWGLNCVGSFLRVLYSVLILSRGGLVFHASALARYGRAYIFFGPSGSGKTTVARVSPDCTLLNDELVAVRPAGDTFRVYATPAWSSSGLRAQGNGSFEIAGIFKLVKDRKVFLERLSFSRAVTEILTCPGFYDDVIAMKDVLNASCRLAQSIPCYELHFLPDNSFWRYIERADLHESYANAHRYF